MTLHNGLVDMTGLRQTLLSGKDNLPASYQSTHMPTQSVGFVNSTSAQVCLCSSFQDFLDFNGF